MWSSSRVLNRYLSAMEHASPAALRKYLREHPGADRSKHTVKKSQPKHKRQEPKSVPGHRSHTELRGIFKPAATEVEASLKPHKAGFDRIDKQATAAAESFESKGVSKHYGGDPTDLMAQAYPKFSLAQKRIHVAGHEVGQRFEKTLSKDERALHDKYFENWRTTATSWDREGRDRPEDFDHTSQELQGFVSSLGVSGSFAPEDEAADKMTSGGVRTAREKATQNSGLQQYAKKMYGYQQAYFKNAGLKELTLFRGVRGREVDGAADGTGVKVQSRELSSFTADPNMAKKFGRVVEFKVPVERVFASSLVRPGIGSETAVGSFNEAEFLIMGASDLPGRTLGKPINRKQASDTIEVPISDENSDWLQHARKLNKNAMARTGTYTYKRSLSKGLRMATPQLLQSDPELEELNPDEDFGELEVAEYVVFLLALDTYMRYVEEHHGHGAEDTLSRRGTQLVRMADAKHMEIIRAFLDSNLPSPGHKRALGRAFQYRHTHEGLGNRSYWIQNLLTRGGPATMKAVFKTPKARKEISEAMTAAGVDDADAALDKFAVIQMRNPRLRKWIATAAQQAGAGTFQNPIQAASNETANATEELLTEKLRESAATPASTDAKAAEAKHTEKLISVESAATAAAQQAMKVSGEPDVPPTKSEVIGIATAAAAAAMSNPEVKSNIPSMLRGQIEKDPEQLDAAMTGGRVLVAAGAGTGKTTTLIGRMAYLVKDCGVPPSRIFAVTFNKEAAVGIEEKITAKIGKDLAEQMSIGTMHATFRRLVMKYGNAEEKAALSKNMLGTKEGAEQRRGKTPRVLNEYLLNTIMSKLWKTCFKKAPPRSPRVVVQSWIMNNISPERALAEARNLDEEAMATWYAWFQGFKGITKGWKPDCARIEADADPDVDAQSTADARTQWTAYQAEFGTERLGDFSDMIVLARDVLKRRPEARKALQDMYDHICVDEAQDLNEVQHEIIAYMSEHVQCDDPKRSLWMVGDEIQSINHFAGARPELFTQFHENGCFKTRMIATNYRCLPEIIEAANTLMTHHPRRIRMTTRPDPDKPRGKASVVLMVPDSNAAGAVDVITDVKQQIQAGAKPKDFAILSRNRIELNDYETACIIEGIPYGRKKGTSFLKSPETTTVLGYMDLVAGADFGKMQQSLATILDKPQRMYLPRGRAEQVVQEVVNKRAHRLGISSKQVNPLELFDREGIYDFVDAAGVQRWAEDRVVDALTELGEALNGIRDTVKRGTITNRENGAKIKYTTTHLIGEILGITGAADKDTGEKKRLLDVLMPVNFANQEDDEADDPDEDVNEEKPIGNVAFLYQIASGEPTPEVDPSDPLKFKARLDDLEARAEHLRYDLTAWRAEQKNKPPEKRLDPPCVTLSTAHSVKGGQWANTTVVMAGGVFPRTNKEPPEVKEPTPEEYEKLTDQEKVDLKNQKEDRIKFLTERQVAYVAMTRASDNLTVVSPMVNAYGMKTSGPTLFVQEAGLNIGQNVPGKSPDAEMPSTPDRPGLVNVRDRNDEGEAEPIRTVLAYYSSRIASQIEPPDDGYDWRVA